MPDIKTISLLVTGGEANAGPPLGPALGPLGVNVMAVVKRINELTADYAGMRVPVKVSVNTENKSFDVEVGLPTTSALIAKEAKVSKGSGNPKSSPIGNISSEQLVKLAKIKLGKTYSTSIFNVAKEIIGSCISMGITIDGKDPRQFLEEVTSGKDNNLFSGSESN
ncbi:MAG: 50S ribosomal protein L11 [Nitrososphaerota archaeon]